MVERRTTLLLALGIGLVIAGTALGWYGHTAGGEVETRETTFETASGVQLDGTVYLPADASTDDPRPGVLAVHGYTGSRGTMGSFGTELARRGYVVLAMDQPGHGTSDPPAFADGWGGPAGLATLRSLESVDESRVGLVGHSMGGYSSLAGARAHPDGYESLVLVGSTAGRLGSPEANATFPRNLAVVWGRYDEYSGLMWGADVPANVPESQQLRTVFGIDEPAEPGRVYGSVSDGTARRITLPPAIHQAEHVNGGAVRDVTDWFDRTLGQPGSASGHVWHLAELGAVLNFLGSVVVLFGLAGVTTRRLDLAPASADGADATRYRWGLAVAASVVPALAFYPLLAIGTEFVPTSVLFPQQLTNAVLCWAGGSLLVVAGVRRLLARVTGVSTPSLGARLREAAADGTGMGRSLAVAGVALVGLSALVLVFDAVGVSASAWLLAFRPVTPLRLLYALAYGPLFVGVAVAMGAMLHRELATDRSLARRVGRNLAITSGGLFALLLVQYVPLFLGQGLPVPALASGTVYGTTVISRIAFATVLSTLVYDRTGRLLPTAVVVAAVLVGFFVGGGPIHVAP